MSPTAERCSERKRLHFLLLLRPRCRLQSAVEITLLQEGLS